MHESQNNLFSFYTGPNTALQFIFHLKLAVWCCFPLKAIFLSIGCPSQTEGINSRRAGAAVLTARAVCLCLQSHWAKTRKSLKMSV